MVAYLCSALVENEATVTKQPWKKAAVALKTNCKLSYSVEMRQFYRGNTTCKIFFSFVIDICDAMCGFLFFWKTERVKKLILGLRLSELDVSSATDCGFV